MKYYTRILFQISIFFSFGYRLLYSPPPPTHNINNELSDDFTSAKQNGTVKMIDAVKVYGFIMRTLYNNISNIN